MIHHITRKKGQITAIRCKGCGTAIQGLVPHPGASDTVRRAGNTIIRESYVHMAPNNSYREFGIILKTIQGRMQCHITHCCDKCYLSLERMNPELLKTLRKWYEEDLDDMRTKTPGAKLSKAHYDSLMKNTVIGVDLTAGLNIPGGDAKGGS